MPAGLGGDGYATMADGTQTFMFSFGPLSGLADIANGLPGTGFRKISIGGSDSLLPGDPAQAITVGRQLGRVAIDPPLECEFYLEGRRGG